ncbi:Murein DD-endopeptidase MepM and murein hydrolase activator NlpD, contain LysM domain [Poseidonocella pacifica]|uniref:Murein DD-endopeptidase MepM and murein hydrolase activator NlpD, contain LysM domain n=1 Tax=Poseidonocella pacifica TaxID=871651 RepID=A0A1I0V8W8_9RHOB|nr:LysM peptidoglycan-binding domain-containing protein [Poseidonocella pacifica]SFA72470.1 Murein DD-endopeptidase MepM and murein hydrolase activator NlpD, contain LysM domain [Poseidonocella pacifica]
MTPKVLTHTPLRMTIAVSALALLAACEGPVDYDIRDTFGRTLDTSEAAIGATSPRPEPDDRGIISYPTYQVAVARRGDTLGDLARRVGVDADELARYNGIQTGDALREGELIALNTRVSEPSPATGATTAGPIRPASDITAIAGRAIDQSDSVRTTPLEPATSTTTAAPSGAEPTRHKVQRGETAFTISRLYGVSVRALSEWNGLDSNFTIREGQFLLIPVSAGSPPVQQAATATTAPGTGSPTPTPPSASAPLPEEDVAAPAPSAPAAPVATPSGGRLAYPVQGSIIREYAKGRNDGIDISATSAAPIKAAEAGTVAAITRNTENIPIVVIRHADGLLTVYANVGDLNVAKGDTVSRGQQIAKARAGSGSYVHFEVRNGFDSVDPVPYLN